MELFFEAQLGAKRKKLSFGALPPVPATGWRLPKEFPNLSGVKCLSFDTETKETDFDHGPGWARGKGHVIGFSLATDDAAWYFPIRHEEEGQYNLDPKNALAWLKTVMETPNIHKVGANLIYDVGWLSEEGIDVQGPLYDVQFAEALLNESGLVNLDHLGEKYCGTGKETSVVYDWMQRAYPRTPKTEQRRNLWRTSPRLVGPYAEADARLPLQILRAQWPLLRDESLLELFRLECNLIPLLVAMRRQGVTVDVEKAEELYGELAIRQCELERELNVLAGFEVNAGAGGDLGRVFDQMGLGYSKTAAGNPSFHKEFLASVEHPVADLIRGIRELDKLKGTFLQAYIIESHVNGKIFCQFHPLRADRGGTRSGRFASSSPNLQNIPSRTALGKKIRSLFIPDPGHDHFRKYDYSQIEYRFLAHFALGQGSDAVRAAYRQDASTDYHVLTQQLVKDKTGKEIERKPIKNINFGLLYGMGEPKLAKNLKVSTAEAKEIFAAYHGGAPYVKATMKATAAEAQAQGIVTTILGRRSRFNLWEPKRVDYDDRAKPLPFEAAVRVYGSGIQRAHTHKAINRRLQGSAADLLKYAMLRCWKDGIFHATGVPRLTVHDELDFSVSVDTPTMREAFREMQHILETALPLRVPIQAEGEWGPNWGEMKAIDA